MRPFITEKFILPLSDILRKRKMASTYKRLLKSQWLTLDELKTLQEEKLKKLLFHASRQVPYYAKIISEQEIESTSASLHTLSTMPPLTRDIVRETYRTESIIAQNKQDYKYVVQRTGGSSTGEPLTTLEDMGTADAGRASFYRGLNWADWHIGERSLKLWGQKTEKTLSQWLNHTVLNWQLVDAFAMSEAIFLEVYHHFQKEDIRHIYSYVSALVEFCEFLKRNNLKVPPPISVMTTAEVLTDRAKSLIENVLETRVFNGYACGEVNGIAYECEQRDGLHISMERCIIEIVDENGQPKPEGEIGRIAVTDLDNYVMPLIRYINGDEGILTREKCKCGRSLVRLKEISGRTCDIIDGVNGKQVHSYFFTALFGRFNWEEEFGLKRYQIVQETPKRLLLKLEMTTPPTKEEKKRMTTFLKHYLGNMDIVFSINNNDLFTSKSGKLRWTINTLR